MATSPDYCPNCGAEVPTNARACPECGADEETGWSDRAHAEGLGIPDEEFNYDEFVKEEFGGKQKAGSGIHWFWWVIAVILLVACLAMFIR